MPANQLMRPQFFEGQYLGAEDLTAALDYSRIASARHLLGAHTWGIAIGLGIKEIDGPGGEVLVFIQPGFAWDGFGRPIVLLTPASIPADLFKSFVYDPLQDEPDGRMVEVWLRLPRDPYAGTRRRLRPRARPGNDFARALETYTIEVGQRDDCSAARQHHRRGLEHSGGGSVPRVRPCRSIDPRRVHSSSDLPRRRRESALAHPAWLCPMAS